VAAADRRSSSSSVYYDIVVGACRTSVRVSAFWSELGLTHFLRATGVVDDTKMAEEVGARNFL